MNNNGFTFIEILIAVALLLLLFAATVIFLDPVEQFARARDNQREADVHDIWYAANFKLTQEGQVCDFDLPSEIDGENKPSFEYIGTEEVDLFSCIVPLYMAEKREDPTDGSEENTGYMVWQHPETNRVSIYAPHSEVEDKIFAGVSPEKEIEL